MARPKCQLTLTIGWHRTWLPVGGRSGCSQQHNSKSSLHCGSCWGDAPKTKALYEEVHLSQIIKQQETQIDILKTALWDSDDKSVLLRRKLTRLEHKLDAVESVEQPSRTQEPPDQPVQEPMADSEQLVEVESVEEKTARPKNSVIDDVIV